MHAQEHDKKFLWIWFGDFLTLWYTLKPETIPCQENMLYNQGPSVLSAIFVQEVLVSCLFRGLF